MTNQNNELDVVASCGYVLIKKLCMETGAAAASVTFDKVTVEDKLIGNWKITVEQL